jgi:hypothetical protein
MGKYKADGRHLQAVVDLHDPTHSGSFVDHGLRMSDVTRDDRMNFLACVRRSSNKVLGLLESRLRGKLATLGTETLLEVNKLFMLVFFGKKCTLRQKVRYCGYIVTLLRLWRISCLTNPSITLHKNFLPYQTFNHVVMQCMCAVLYIKLFRDFCPSAECALGFLGSDACERLFAEAGGFGAIASHMRNYNFKEFCDFVTKSNTIEDLKCGKDGITWYARASKTEYQNKYHEDVHAPNADLKDYPSDIEMKASWERGADDARAKCVELEMKGGIPDDLWADPSKANDLSGLDTKGMAAYEKFMRDANEVCTL